MCIAAGYTGFQPFCDMHQVGLMLGVCVHWTLHVKDRWKCVFVRSKPHIVWRKGWLLMVAWRNPWDLTWNRCDTSFNDIRLAALFMMYCRSVCWFGFVQVNQAYQPRHKRCSLPPYSPNLATSNISPINKANTKYNGQSSEKKLFTTFGRKIWPIDEALHMPNSCSQWRQD